jgi:hypothetical protein
VTDPPRRLRWPGPWVVVLAVAMLPALAVLAYVWLTHVDPYPSSAALRCNDIDPFRCHDSADRGIAALQDALPSVRHRGLDRVIEVAVQSDEAFLHRCDGYQECPPMVIEYFARVSFIDAVTIHHGILFDEIQVARCENGDYRVMVLNLPIIGGPSRSLC